MKTTPQQLAQQLRQVHEGGNWTAVNVKEVLADVSWQEAVTNVPGFHSIAVLTYHIHYFVNAVIPVFEGGELNAHDKFSFDAPSITPQPEWDELRERVLMRAAHLAQLIEALPAGQLTQPFWNEKYGTYHRNILGIIEHTHYHLGQIVVLKRLVQQEKRASS